MADIFDQLQTADKPDIFDQITRTPADVNPQMQDAKWGASNPILRGLQNTGEQAFINPIYQAVKSVSPAVNGIEKGIGYAPKNPAFNSPSTFVPPDMTNAPMAAKVLGNVAGGASQGLAASALGRGNPFVGYGALSALGAYGKGENPIPAALGGAASAVPQYLGGLAGSSLASAAAKPLGEAASSIAPRIGTALGMGGVSAAMAPPGQKIEAGASGAAFGLLSPMNPIGSPKVMSQEDYDNELDKGADIYRHVLNPGKGIINKVEIKSGGDIDDSMRLAAKDGLIINSNEGKLDNSAAIQQIQSKVAPLYDMQNKILAENSAKQFSIQDLADEAKGNIDDPNHPAFQKNAADAEAAKANIQNEADAEILRHGENVDGQSLNMIKQGLWGKSYNPLEPNANDGARALGFAAKNAIEKAYPDDLIAENNAKIGQYLQLQRILEQVHGQVVQGGKIGQYAARATGAVAGGIVSAHMPFLGELAGPIVGQEAGARVNQYLNDPARITGNWAKNISNIKVDNPEPIEPQVMEKPFYKQYQEQQKGISQNPINALPSPKDVAYSPSQHTVMGEGSIKQGSESAPGVIEAGRPEKSYEPGPEAIITPSPGTPENAQTFPQSNINPLANVQKGSANDPLGKKIAPLAIAGALGIGSVFNPINSQAATVKDSDRLKLSANQYVMKNEGWKAMPYLDTNGNKTVGYGFKEGGMAWKYIPDAVKQGRRALTKQEGMYAFNKAYPSAMASAQKFAGDSWGTLSNNQQKALIDMSYQMGTINFPKLKVALEQGNYNTAAKEILNSKYARKDAPNRALQNAVLIQS